MDGNLNPAFFLICASCRRPVKNGDEDCYSQQIYLGLRTNRELKSAVSHLMLKQMPLYCVCWGSCICVHVCTCVSEYKENLDISTTFDLFLDKSVPWRFVCSVVRALKITALCASVSSGYIYKPGRMKMQERRKIGNKEKTLQQINLVLVWEYWRYDKWYRNCLASYFSYLIYSHIGWMISAISQRSACVILTSGPDIQRHETATTFGAFTEMLINVNCWEWDFLNPVYLSPGSVI